MTLKVKVVSFSSDDYHYTYRKDCYGNSFLVEELIRSTRKQYRVGNVYRKYKDKFRVRIYSIISHLLFKYRGKSCIDQDMDYTDYCDECKHGFGVHIRLPKLYYWLIKPRVKVIGYEFMCFEISIELDQDIETFFKFINDNQIQLFPSSSLSLDFNDYIMFQNMQEEFEIED